jgi:hypothetical protein
MKELSIEEKARAYDEAIGNMRKFRDALSNHEETDLWVLKKEIVTDIEYYFPELKENDSEKIRKELIDFVKSRLAGFPECDRFIAWLKKQGENKPVIEMKSPEESLGISSKEYNEIVNNCLYSESKPNDKVEPKFKVGDWVRAISSGNIFKILSVNDGLYRVLCYDGVEANYPIEEVEKDLTYWTIQDTKDGDVLNSPSHRLIWIYKDKEHYYACVNMNYVTKNVATDGLISIPNDVCPATKDERTILFEKMKESEYEWDAEKKELKKVEQLKLTEFEDAVKDMMDDYRDAIDDNDATVEEVKERAAYLLSLIPHKPAKWGKEDEKIVTGIINDIQKRLEDYPTEQLAERYFKEIKWLKSLKERYGWKPSDDQLHDLKRAIDSFTFEPDYLEELYEDLKNLKGG